MAFHERQLVVVLVDLAHFVRTVAGMDAIEIAGIVERYYTEASARVTDNGGTVVKYLGDGCLAVFPAENAAAAVDAVEQLALRVAAIGDELKLDLAMGANVHLSVVAEGEFGPDKRYDVMGTGVMHTFRMGSGEGIRISEPVYRKLPNDRRGAWSKHQPPATYTRAAG